MGKEIRGLPEAPALKPGARSGPIPSHGAGADGGAVASGADSGAEGEGRPSIGGYLERQRRLRGISLDELANLTRIPVRSLARLEGGAYDGHSDGFARGFVRTVAAAIGLDPEETVARMLPEVRVRRSGMPPRWRQALLLAAILGFAIGAATAGISWWQGWSASGPARTALPVRHDAVRALAIRQGLLAPGAPAVPRPLPPVEGSPEPVAEASEGALLPTGEADAAPQGSAASGAEAAPPGRQAVEAADSAAAAGRPPAAPDATPVQPGGDAAPSAEVPASPADGSGLPDDPLVPGADARAAPASP